jgi:uncharacterized protein YecT (DUF1311 family)
VGDKVTKIGFALLLFFVSSLSCSAQNVPQTKEYEQCMSRASGLDTAVLECISDEYTRQGKRLNAAYRNLMGSFKGDRKRQLLELQRLWDKYTEANCGLSNGANNPTSDRILTAECKLTVRIERCVQLEELAGY